MFMKIDTVDGEAQDTKHKKEIDVLSWSWGISQRTLINKTSMEKNAFKHISLCH